MLENLFTIFSCLFTILQKNLPPLKRILALPTKGQKCTDSVIQPFTYDNFHWERPVAQCENLTIFLLLILREINFWQIWSLKKNANLTFLVNFKSDKMQQFTKTQNSKVLKV